MDHFGLRRHSSPPGGLIKTTKHLLVDILARSMPAIWHNCERHASLQWAFSCRTLWVQLLAISSEARDTTDMIRSLQVVLPTYLGVKGAGKPSATPAATNATAGNIVNAGPPGTPPGSPVQVIFVMPEHDLPWNNGFRVPCMFRCYDVVEGRACSALRVAWTSLKSGGSMCMVAVCLSSLQPGTLQERLHATPITYRSRGGDEAV